MKDGPSFNYNTGMQLAFQIVNVDFIAFVTIVYLLIFLRANRAYDRSVLGRFVPSLVLLAMLAISDNIDYYYSWKPEPHFIRKLAIMAGYILRVYLLMAAVFILKNKNVSLRDRILLFVPATLNALIILSAFFTDRVFYLDADNVLHRELPSFSPHALSLIYFFVVLGIAVRRCIQGYREEGKILIVALATVLVAVTSEIVLKTRGIFISSVSLVLTFYYLYLHMEHYKRDTLTGVLNRMSFFADMSRRKCTDVTALCEFDMNNLKLINDTQGHAAGDRAIITMANAIRNDLPGHSYLYRMGGDEFLALFCRTDMKTVQFIIEKIRAELAALDCSCAIGLTEWTAGQDFQEIYNRADRRMYEDKQRMRELGLARPRA